MSKLKKSIKNEKGAIDLASIMVGIIVIGLIGGVISATVFAVIPWAQDSAAKQQLDSVAVAQSAYKGLSSDPASTLPTGHPANSYADSQALQEANLLSADTSYCTVSSGNGYQAFAKSSSGKLFTITNDNTSPKQAGSWELNNGCEELLQGAPITNPSYNDPAPQLTEMTYKCDTTTNVVTPIRNGVGTATWSGSTPTTHNGEDHIPAKTLQAGVEYVFKFEGTYPKLDYIGLSGASCLRAVNHWGEKTGLTTAAHGFENAANLVDVPAHLPSTVTDISNLFYKATAFNDPDVAKWDVSNVTNMNRMFYANQAFNQPLNNWNTSNVTDMGHMFVGAFAFNQPLNNWNTSKVTDMERTFENTSRFNQPLNNWDVSKVKKMDAMFLGSAFKQDVSGWNTSSVTTAKTFASSSFPDAYMPPKTSK